MNDRPTYDHSTGEGQKRMFYDAHDRMHGRPAGTTYGRIQASRAKHLYAVVGTWPNGTNKTHQSPSLDEVLERTREWCDAGADCKVKSGNDVIASHKSTI